MSFRLIPTMLQPTKLRNDSVFNMAELKWLNLHVLTNVKSLLLCVCVCVLKALHESRCIIYVHNKLVDKELFHRTPGLIRSTGHHHVGTCNIPGLSSLMETQRFISKGQTTKTKRQQTSETEAVHMYTVTSETHIYLAVCCLFHWDTNNMLEAKLGSSAVCRIASQLSGIVQRVNTARTQSHPGVGLNI